VAHGYRLARTCASRSLNREGAEMRQRRVFEVKYLQYTLFATIMLKLVESSEPDILPKS
jgi:hypothetical protein